MNFYLPVIWGFIIAFGIIMYVLLDGFDLGIGILFPWIRNEHHRDIMMNSIAPLWDGNETWLVLGGAILYGAFPIVYSSVLPQLYAPIIMMLAALIFRGVAFEFRVKAEKSKFIWNFAFAGGSTLAAFCQGVILGNFVEGNLSVSLDYLAPYKWLTEFSLMTGFAVIAGYALLGSTWLIAKTEGDLQKDMFHIANVLLTLVIIFLGIVSLWTPFIEPHIMSRWFSLPNFFYLLPIPIITVCAAFYCYYSLYKEKEKPPFFMSIALFILAYIGLGVSSWPYIIPHKLTIWQAASNTKSLLFLLVGASILLPLLIIYTFYGYYVFRGKIKPEYGYHD